VFWKMKASDQKPDRVTYITLLDKCGDSGDSQSVVEIWNTMVADGYNDNIVSYTAVVDALCQVGRLDEALAVFDEMKEKGISPEQYSLTP